MIKSNKKSNDIELGFELQGNVSSTEDDTDGTKQKAKVAKFKI